LPLLAWGGSRVSPSPLWSQLNWVSPFSSFANAAEIRYARRPQTFWVSVLALGCLSWLFLALASFIIPRVWQQAKQRPTALFKRAVSVSQVRGAQKSKARTALLNRNPVLWLASDQIGTQWGAWIIVMLWSVVVLFALLYQPGGTTT